MAILTEHQLRVLGAQLLELMKKPAAPAKAPTVAVASGSGVMGVHLHSYVYTFVTPDGESAPSPAATLTVTSGNTKATVSNVAPGPAGTTARKIYRTGSTTLSTGGADPATVAAPDFDYKLVKTLSDNTTTSFTDEVDDTAHDSGAALSVSPIPGGLGFSTSVKDSSSANDPGRINLKSEALAMAVSLNLTESMIVIRPASPYPVV